MASKRIWGWVGLACLCVWVGGVSADPPSKEGTDEPDARELLKEADAATRAVKAVEYEAEFYGTGSVKDRVFRVKGTLKAKPGKRSLLDAMTGRTGGRQMLRFDGTVQLPGVDEPVAVKVASDGKRVQCINEKTKTFVEGESAQVKVFINALNSIYMREYLFPTPFSDEIEAKVARYEGTKRVGKVKCDVISVQYQNNSESRWYFGQEDHLPRRVDRIVQANLWGGRLSRDDAAGTAKETAYIIKIISLNTQPTLDEDEFTLKRPKGYESRSAGPDDGKEDEPLKLLKPGTEAPDWELAGPDGKTVSLKSLRGKVVVLDFWATWCGACRLSTPAVQKLHERFSDKPVAVVGINIWERDGDPAEYLRSRKCTFGVLVKGEKVAEAYQVNGTPTFYVIGQDGTILYAGTGYEPKTEEEIAEVIEKALTQANRDQKHD
jgi:thiol-disulfide isomerase/thioredoxin